MKKKLLALCFLLMAGGFAEAQQTQRPTRSPNTNSQSGSWTRSRTTTNRSTVNTVPSVSRTPTNVPNRSSAGAPLTSPGGWGSGRGYDPIEPYVRISSQLKDFPGYRSQAWDLYYCDLFYARLRMDFGYLLGQDSFWTFAQGWPALTPHAADLALSTSTQAADRILEATSAWSALLDRYEGKTLSQSELEQESKQLANEIREQTKRVRNDFYVDYLDQREGLDVEKVDRVSSVAELRELIANLRTKALDLRRDFDEYFQDERTKVISVQDLSQPSFKSRSKEIDKLAAAIKKSVVKL